MKLYDAIILGAGAAGLMCASVAGQRGKTIIVLDHADEVGKKIIISGGGRCNFTNLNVLPKCYISHNPHFAKSALGRYTQHDFIAMVERHKIAYHEKTLGQLFCDSSARSIVNMLLDECIKGNVDIRTRHNINNISLEDGLFKISSEKKEFLARNLVLATGGSAIPKMGATSFAYDVARKFKHKIIEPKPALVPLKTPQKQLSFVQNLAGIAVEAIVTCNKTQFRENILFTHRGFSGPAILQISSYWAHGDIITLNLSPDIDVFRFLKDKKQARPKTELKTVLAELLPTRLAHAFAEHYPSLPIATLSDKIMEEIAMKIQAYQFKPSGSEGFAKAEVTLGGIDTAGFSSKTMESKNIKGLFAIGEAMDVTGWLGGYNFQWAWSSGWAAGMSLD